MEYAGIGSRNTPTEVLQIFETLGYWFAQRKHTLRSGGAKGADSAFERGCARADALDKYAVIYIPWEGFNDTLVYPVEITPEAEALARKFHPRYDTLSQGAQKLIARNGYQILGYDLDDPVDFIVCWTPHGSGQGGTGQALRIAKAYNIPIFDFGMYTNLDIAKKEFNKFYKEIAK